MIDACFKGKDDGLKAGADAERTLLPNALQNNMGHAGRDTVKVLSACKAHRLPVDKALLRIDAWHRFSVMVVVDENGIIKVLVERRSGPMS